LNHPDLTKPGTLLLTVIQ